MLQFYVILVILAIYLYFKWHLSFFVRRGIAGPKPLPFVGNLWDYVSYRKHFGQIYDQMYQSYPNANYVGFYKLNQPAVLVRDLDIVKDVVAGDFSSFHDNDIVLDPKLDPLFILDPFFSRGDQWKALRNLLSPTFSYAKVKAYFPLMEEVCKNLVEWIENGPESKSADGIETKSIGEMYTVDVVASCGFGVEGKSFTNIESPFRKLIGEIISPTASNIIKFFVTLFMPKIAPILGIPFLSKDHDAWVRSFVDEVIKRRIERGEKRQDFLQAFMDLQKKKENAAYAKDLLPAMAITFLTEGTETSSSLICFALYELSKNPDVVRRAQEELKEVFG
uniref:Uncharacterized protein n=1 Tax=Phlebotomus papatasi TaxID=29031 RepID=A0A1B0GMN3_PHLPP